MAAHAMGVVVVEMQDDGRAGILGVERTFQFFADRGQLIVDGEAVFGSVDKAWFDGFYGFMGKASVNYKAIMLRNIRTVFNWAIDNELTTNYPFRRYKIKQEKVAINNISVEQLREIRDCEVEEWQRIYRDLFLLTFYLCL